MNDNYKKLLKPFLRVLVLVIFAYALAIISILPAITAHRSTTQMKMGNWADMAGHYQAKVFFDEGRYRLLELAPITKIDAEHFASKFTDKHEGVFEVWTRPIYVDTNSDVNHRLFNWLNKDDSDQKFVESFNQAMKQLWNEKQTNTTGNLQTLN